MRRVVFFNLTQIRMPVGAVTSIAHRVSGILLALGIPVSVYILDLSLRSSQSYAQAQRLLAGTTFRVGAILFVWALAHHLLAGVRHLLGDIDVGSRLALARRSAWAVNGTGFMIALLAAWGML